MDADPEAGTPKRVFKVKEKRVVYFSQELAEKKRYELNRIRDKLAGLVMSKAKKSAYGSMSEYVIFRPVSKDGEVGAAGERVIAEINEEAFAEKWKWAGYNMLVTSEIEMDDQEIYNAYHHLWRIEETFRIMKTDLESRPVFLQKRKRIYAHFVICYAAIAVLRYLELVVFHDKKTMNQILEFLRGFKVMKVEGKKFYNVMKRVEIQDDFNRISPVLVDLFCYSQKQLEDMLNRGAKLPPKEASKVRDSSVRGPKKARL